MISLLSNLLHGGPLDGKKKIIGILLFVLPKVLPNFPMVELQNLIDYLSNNAAPFFMLWGLVSDLGHKLVKSTK